MMKYKKKFFDTPFRRGAVVKGMSELARKGETTDRFQSDAALSPQCRKKGVLILPDIILPYEPIVITDTTDLPRDEWLAYRKTGIGGSDVAAILGISPFGTARDIYYDKLSIASFYDDEANKYQKKIGTLLEDVVAEMFAEVTGYRVFKIRKMFRSREHSFYACGCRFFCPTARWKFCHFGM